MLESLDNNKYALLVGRVALALIYFLGGLTWLFSLSPPIDFIASKGFPAPALLGWLALMGLVYHLLPQLGYRAVDVYARIVSLRAQEGRQLAGLEFTSLDAAVSDKIQLYVQMRIQDEAPA